MYTSIKMFVNVLQVSAKVKFDMFYKKCFDDEALINQYCLNGVYCISSFT